MRMSERHMDLEEQRQADEWQEYLLWWESERQLNELEEKQHAENSARLH